MRIGLVSPYDYATPGGVNQHVHHLAGHLRALGHEVRELAPSSQRRLVAPDYERVGGVVPVPVNASVARINLNPRNTRRVNEILLRERFDVIHLHEPFMPALPLTVLRASRTANVGTFHAYARRNLGYYYTRGLLGHYYLKRLHATVAVSRPAREFLRQYFPNLDPVIIPNGVDVQRFQPGHPPIRHLRDDCVNFLFVGRLEKRKGLPDLIRGFERAHAREPKTRLIIVGEGPMKHHLEQYIQQHRVPHVVLAGRVPGEVLPRYHATADVLCAPATGESFGIVLLEAMASRLPVLCTEIPGYLSVVTSGQDALTVAPHSPVEIGAGMVVLARDPLLRQRLGESGMARARQQYSWPVVTAQLLEVYRQARARAGAEVGDEEGWRAHDAHSSVG